MSVFRDRYGVKPPGQSDRIAFPNICCLTGEGLQGLRLDIHRFLDETDKRVKDLF